MKTVNFLVALLTLTPIAGKCANLVFSGGSIGKFSEGASIRNVGFAAEADSRDLQNVMDFYKQNGLLTPRKGDINEDGKVDIDDLTILNRSLNTTTMPGDIRDLNGDGKIDALDARILTTLCDKPRCAK